MKQTLDKWVFAQINSPPPGYGTIKTLTKKSPASSSAYTAKNVKTTTLTLPYSTTCYYNIN
jgi:hypothetical protein